jgi:hypothetical protein
LILIQSLLGLNNPVDAASQFFSLEGEFPYGAQIHFTAYQVILAGAMVSYVSNNAVLGLCDAQLRNELPVLEKGKGIEGKGSSVPPNTLFLDAVRCFDFTRDLRQKSAQAMLTRLQAIVQLPAWRGTALVSVIQSALSRAEMLGDPPQTLTISGKLIRATGPLPPLAIDPAHGTKLLISTTLWSQNAFSIVRELSMAAPQQQIYLLTNWAANTGLADVESKDVLESLRSASLPLPAHGSILVVPNYVLAQLHAAAFPGAMVVRASIVLANLPLVGDAGKRMNQLALHPSPPGSVSRHHPRKQAAK